MKTQIIISNWTITSSNTQFTTNNPSYKRLFNILNKDGLGFSEVYETNNSKGFDNTNKTYHIELSDNPTPTQYEKIIKLKNLTIINN
jgi:hypothetical protein|tara:strand:+ start:2029 stop:2289 length:261 start_codon:yes stop_codon:yes gene_type:complete